ncbi:hypothetical protein C8A05DRAFT_20328 [Staphylotrichum tortipilum]|uniref:Uncharacterized protein n=1 Tax=Staphylotrichum tortipilum TaxID=2831512 RepID=A0AAN6MAD1_9PEZI|nr:hypothetical protein C8A05DRAFT_20328 [Staphylotrichum longicolle]
MGQVKGMRADQANEREATKMQIRVLQDKVASLLGTPTTTPQSLTLPAPLEAIVTPPGVVPMPPAPPEVTIAPPSAPGQTKKRATLPDPPRFDGNRSKFPAWLLEMQNKLQTDGEALGSSRDQFNYVFSRLGFASVMASLFKWEQANLLSIDWNALWTPNPNTACNTKGSVVVTVPTYPIALTNLQLSVAVDMSVTGKATQPM